MNPLHLFVYPFIPSLTLKKLVKKDDLSISRGLGVFFIGILILAFSGMLVLYLDGGYRFDSRDIEAGERILWSTFLLICRSGLQLYFIYRILSVLKIEFDLSLLVYIYSFSILSLFFEIIYGRVVFFSSDELSLFSLAWFTIILLRGVLFMLSSDIIKTIVVVFGSFFMTFFFEWLFREFYAYIVLLF